MRIMAFDYGTKRIGIAVTDPLQIVASALTTLHPEKLWDFLKAYFLTEQVGVFVVGKPLQLDGSNSQSTKYVEEFIKKLQQQYPDIPIERIDERFTSKMATAVIAQSGMKKKKKGNKAIVDVISATIILQDYLSSKSPF